MNVRDFLQNVALPPKCMLCRKFLPLTEKRRGHEFCLCEACLHLWERAKTENCPECLCPSHYCLCAPSEGRLKRFKISKLLTYTPEKHDTQGKVILAIKRRNERRVIDFLADELAVSLCRYLKDEGILPDECIFTYVPRRKRSVNRYGFDQGMRLAQEVAKVCEGEFRQLFARVGGREQKKLDRGDRLENIEKSIMLHKDAASYVRGRTVVVVDDLVTTGATLGHAARLLRSIGAASVYVTCIAKTANTENMKTT